MRKGLTRAPVRCPTCFTRRKTLAQLGKPLARHKLCPELVTENGSCVLATFETAVFQSQTRFGKSFSLMVKLSKGLLCCLQCIYKLPLHFLGLPLPQLLKAVAATRQHCFFPLCCLLPIYIAIHVL